MDQETREFLICLTKQLELIQKLAAEDHKQDCYPASFSQEEIDVLEQLTKGIMHLNRLSLLIRYKFPQLKYPTLL